MFFTDFIKQYLALILSFTLHSIVFGVLPTFKLSVFSPNAGKYRPEKTPYLDTFHAVLDLKIT